MKGYYDEENNKNYYDICDNCYFDSLLREKCFNGN